MKRHVVLDGDCSMIGYSEYPIVIGDRGSTEVEVPDDVDLDRIDCYRYIDSEFVFDEVKWAERVKE